MLSVEAIVAACCKALKLPRSGVELSVNIVSPQKMRSLNKTYRGKDKPTDVLSFPIRVKHDILYLGDIFINRTDAKKNLPFLVVHGFLHLMDYDHERSEREEKIMFTLQDEILSHLRN
ncbi:MAG: rRNA maturation RNase YbeY [Patescibacteria group bacterium]